VNASTRLLADLLERGVYLERFAAKELRALLPILEQAHEEVLGKIAATGGEWTQAWLAETAANIERIYNAAAEKLSGQLHLDLEPLATEEAAWTKSALETVTGGLSVQAPAAATLWAGIKALPAAGGSTLGQLCAALGMNNATAVTEAIQLSMAEGETIDQMVRRLRGRVIKRASWRKGEDGRRHYIPGVYSGGVMTLSTPQAEQLARTAAMHVGNQAREAVYAENADLVKGYQRVETLDSRTCLVCGVADGQIVKAGESRAMLPVHPGCRGVWLPVLKSWRELGIDADEIAPGTRASMDGQVSEYETWRDLLEKAGPARRVEILGPSRARLYAQGYPLDALVKDGRVVPLAELPKRGAA